VDEFGTSQLDKLRAIKMALVEARLAEVVDNTWNMQRAFTILEMLAATALTALLLAAVLHVVAALGRSRADLARQTDVGVWRSEVLDTLRYDLENAGAANFHMNGVTLSGHGALDRNTLAHQHEPVVATYGLINIHGRSWLVRMQSSRNRSSGDTAWSELLCPDVTGFAVQPAGSVFTVPPGVDRDSIPDQSIPMAVSVSLSGPAGRIMTETLVLR
jgi:hypothetical protein